MFAGLMGRAGGAGWWRVSTGAPVMCAASSFNFFHTQFFANYCYFTLGTVHKTINTLTAMDQGFLEI